jgi:hypothetical protein
MVVYTWNPSTQGAEAKRLLVLTQLGQHSETLYQKKGKFKNK